MPLPHAVKADMLEAARSVMTSAAWAMLKSLVKMLCGAVAVVLLRTW